MTPNVATRMTEVVRRIERSPRRFRFAAASRWLSGSYIRSGATLLGILVLWQVVCGLGIVAPNKFPSLGDSLAALATLIREPYAGLTLGGHLLESLTRWGVGLCCALLIGIPFGASLAWFRPFRSASRPIFEFLRYIPPLAWVPLAILMWGPSLKAEAFVVFVGAVPPVIINVWNGVASVDSVIVSAARMLGAGSLRTLLTVALPASMLSILTGVRLAVGGGWASLIGAELVGAQSGLGFIIINAEADNRSDYIVAGMLVIGVMGALIDVSFRLLARRFTRWQGVAL